MYCPQSYMVDRTEVLREGEAHAPDCRIDRLDCATGFTDIDELVRVSYVTYVIDV